MVVTQLFEVTLVADGSELSSKRVSKLSRKYHLHKKQLRQSAMMMAEGLSDAAAAAAAAADGGNDDDDSSELSPKRVSKLSRKFHLHKK
jgi:mevalonate pyrophosphate decarboxylase